MLEECIRLYGGDKSRDSDLNATVDESLVEGTPFSTDFFTPIKELDEEAEVKISKQDLKELQESIKALDDEPELIYD